MANQIGGISTFVFDHPTGVGGISTFVFELHKCLGGIGVFVFDVESLGGVINCTRTFPVPLPETSTFWQSQIGKRKFPI